MILNDEIKLSIDKSVLCWLATSDKENFPNVSPKEVFDWYENETIIIANIASPQSIRNIAVNDKVCISFIDILVQKGFQLKGKAEIVERGNSRFIGMELKLNLITDGKFPFNTIVAIKIESAKKIIAPKYILYPDTTEMQQIESARKSYGLE